MKLRKSQLSRDALQLLLGCLMDMQQSQAAHHKLQASQHNRVLAVFINPIELQCIWVKSLSSRLPVVGQPDTLKHLTCLCEWIASVLKCSCCSLLQLLRYVWHFFPIIMPYTARTLQQASALFQGQPLAVCCNSFYFPPLSHHIAVIKSLLNSLMSIVDTQMVSRRCRQLQTHLASFSRRIVIRG